MTELNQKSNESEPTDTFEDNIILSQSYKKKLLLTSLIAVMMIMSLTGLDSIPANASPLYITIAFLQIPIIIGACLLGPTTGIILGFICATVKLMTASFSMLPTSFLFSPFARCEIYGYFFEGNAFSLIICFVPRILLGFVVGFLFKFLNKDGSSLKYLLSCAISSFIATTLYALLMLFFSNIFFYIKLWVLPNKYDIIYRLNSTLTNSYWTQIVITTVFCPFIVFIIKKLVKLKWVIVMYIRMIAC